MEPQIVGRNPLQVRFDKEPTLSFLALEWLAANKMSAKISTDYKTNSFIITIEASANFGKSLIDYINNNK